MLIYATLLFLIVVDIILAATAAAAVRGTRKKTGSSYSSSSYSSYQSSLINSSYQRAASPFELDGEPVVVYITIPSVVLYSLVSGEIKGTKEVN